MPANKFSIEGNLVDVWKKEIYPAKIHIADEKIVSIVKTGDIPVLNDAFILPGFIDSHVHVESSMIIPSEFARLAVVHGTVASVSDPHEIANVCGVRGVEYMIENGKQVPFKFNFGAPSCVPATGFETAGAILNSDEVEQLLKQKEIKYLSEMMNFPGVLFKDDEVMKKIAAARALNKPVDGHAPGLMGGQAKQYIEAGISTDHECFTMEEALDKLKYGMKIIIREGSAARNFEALIALLHDHPEKIMFCSDDKHPDSLVAGHINRLCARAVAKGVNLFKVLQAACINPVEHYGLEVGMLRIGDAADFVVVGDVQHFNVLQTYINGQLVADKGRTLISSVTAAPINNFGCNEISASDIEVPYNNEASIPVIEALDGQLITNKLSYAPAISGNFIVSDTTHDILKMVVVNRYRNERPAITFIKNFNLKRGAIASSVAHDSHNIISVGVDDASITKAINLIIKEKGGVSCVDGPNEKVLPLPVAGLMSADDGYKVAAAYTEIDAMAKKQGSTLSAPYMTLSFMALLVIPHLKLSDLGLFDGDAFRLVER